MAARYAQAPSYSQMQAAEAACTGARAASAAARGREQEAEQAPAPARPAPQTEEPIVTPAESAPAFVFEAAESEYPSIRWQPEVRLQPESAESLWGNETIEPVEPDLPIAANLIEFPRELVATRKVRPRLVEGPFAETGAEQQLSIFEVDPGALSTQPEAAGAAPAPEWCGIELEAQPQDETEPQTSADAPLLKLAPLGNRLMALLVDGALIAGAFLGAALMALAHAGQPPAVKVAECAALAALLLVGLLYQTLFLTLAEATPGMRYAHISLCAFDGRPPTRAQQRGRLAALLLSVLSMGLGFAWVLFDDDRLSWHDRLSRTYLRKC